LSSQKVSEPRRRADRCTNSLGHKAEAAIPIAVLSQQKVRDLQRLLGMARSNLAKQLKPAIPRCRCRPPQPDTDLLARIKAVTADMPTYGYRRVHAILRRKAAQEGGSAAPNHKRVRRVMKEKGLLLQRHAGGEARRHDGRIAMDERNRRWCSDGFEIGCDNGERVRVAFALDCCDREAMSFIAIET
jgi:putative transposase